MPRFTRRSILAAPAILPVSALPFAATARAEAPMLGASFARHRRFTLGSFEVTTLLAATRAGGNPHDIFGLNVSAEDFAATAEANFLSPDTVPFFFTPTVVNTGEALVLFDAGPTAAATTSALAQAGYSPDQVDVVVITHMHGDHIGGLMDGGAPTYPNARYVTGQVEFDHWQAAGNDRFESFVRPLADQFAYLADGQDVITGISAVAAFGHTPGHMVYRLDSDGQGLLVMADLANHAVWSLAHPDWEVRFDIDKQAAAASRRRLLGMAAADRLPAIFYHLPFPGLGFVEANGDGFRWVPEAGQFMG